MTTLGSTFDRRKKFGVGWAVAPPRDGRLSNFCDFFLPLFSRTSLQVRRDFRQWRQTTWLRWYMCLLGGNGYQNSYFGVSAPKTAKISPQTGKSHLKLECVITFKRWEIDIKSQWNTIRKSVIGFHNRLTIFEMWRHLADKSALRRFRSTNKSVKRK